MTELTRDEILEIVCASAITDEPEELDFVDGNEAGEENYVKNLIKQAQMPKKENV